MAMLHDSITCKGSKATGKLPWWLLVITTLVAFSEIGTVAANTLRPVVLVNVGGETFVHNNVTWKAEDSNMLLHNHNNTVVIQTNHSIQYTNNPRLYQSGRQFSDAASSLYNTTIPKNGRFLVALYFCEIDATRNAAGLRVFNVSIQRGEFEIANLDLFHQGGGLYRAVTPFFAFVDVDDNVLTVELTPIGYHPLLSGIGVYEFVYYGPDRSNEPSSRPTVAPSVAPSDLPSLVPTLSQVPSDGPTSSMPSDAPSLSPTTSQQPTVQPTNATSLIPTAFPTQPTGFPTVSPAGTKQPEWVQIRTRATHKLIPRHEACFVMANNRKAYLIGGRRKTKINALDLRTHKWKQEPGPGMKLHHMNCIAVDDNIWIVSAWRGNCCQERNVENVLVYDTVNRNWETKTALPEERRRGGGASILHGRDIYVIGGNRGGHGRSGIVLAWFDKYNIDTDTWTTNLTNAPHARDHTGGGVVDNKLCVAGGRDSGGRRKYFNRTVLPTDCYNLDTGVWETWSDIPQGRAGAAYGTLCDGTLMVAGGEGFGTAWDTVDIFNGTDWTSIAGLQTGRHGTGLAVDCVCQRVYIASGSDREGSGSADLNSTEVYNLMDSNNSSLADPICRTYG